MNYVMNYFSLQDELPYPESNPSQKVCGNTDQEGNPLPYPLVCNNGTGTCEKMMCSFNSANGGCYLNYYCDQKDGSNTENLCLECPYENIPKGCPCTTGLEHDQCASNLQCQEVHGHDIPICLPPPPNPCDLHKGAEGCSCLDCSTLDKPYPIGCPCDGFYDDCKVIGACRNIEKESRCMSD